jgi:hypothetical protein
MIAAGALAGEGRLNIGVVFVLSIAENAGQGR